MLTRVVIMDMPIKDDGTFKHNAAKQELSEKINHNSVLFNFIVRNGSKVVHPGTNLIDQSTRSIFKKQPSEFRQLKEMKRHYKSGTHADTGFLEPATREEIIRAFATSKDPDFNINFIVLKK